MKKDKSQIKSRVRSLLWDFIHSNEWQDLDDFSLRLANQLNATARNPSLSTERIQEALAHIRTNFFVANKVSKRKFAQLLSLQLSQTDLPEYTDLSSFERAQGFISQHLEIGYDKSKLIEERKRIIADFGTIKSPHARLMDAFGTLLQRVVRSFQVALHGTKEYSGIDISKGIEGAIIGFQIKSVNDDISEDKIRSQVSKAQEYGLDGFVWIYGRPLSKDVESSIQAAYHYFTRLNEKEEMYCAIIHPELLAELFLKYGIGF